MNLKLYHNGIEIDKAVFAKTFRAKTGFYSLFDYIQDKFKSWRDAWVKQLSLNQAHTYLRNG